MVAKLIVICSILCAVSVDVVYSDRKYVEDQIKHVHSKTPAEMQQQAASEVIARLLPNYSHLFNIVVDPELSLNSFKLEKTANDTTLQISASSGVAACKGFYYYFKNNLGGHVSWSGNRIPKFPDQLPAIHYHSQSASKFIYHQNVCTWSYSFAWWTWNDWRKHIDWMAFMGVSLTIAPIQEAIWTKVYRRFGLTDREIDTHLSGPGFFAWQRMGNIRGWGGPLPNSFKQKQLALQKEIIRAERNLGMTVAVPAFAGHVPDEFERLFPNTTLTRQTAWNHFPQEDCCTMFVGPDQQLFQEIGRKFLREVIQEYGTDHIYFSDPFNENQPHKGDPMYLAQTSRSIHQAMKQVDEKAIWLLQNWMFESNPFWTKERMKAFLTAVPIGQMLVLDLQSEMVPQYEKTDSYFGQPFIWCMLHNYGGTLGMHGSVEIVNTRIGLTWRMTNNTMVGVGITMEGINQNDILYEFALDRGWQLDDLNEKEWFDQYSATRYGYDDLSVRKTNDLIRKSVYAYRGLFRLHGKYTLVMRPSIKIRPWTWYEPAEVESAWTAFLQASSSIQNNSFYQQDLVDLTRQVLQNKIDHYYINIIDQYDQKNLTVLQILSADMSQLFQDLEQILSSSPRYLLGRWLTAAKGLAINSLESILYEYNARNQITTWGPSAQINDYANKQWSGLMADYYWKRWQMFLKDLNTAVKFNRNFNEKQFRINVFRDIESPFTYNRKIYPDQPKGDTVTIAKDIHKRWFDHKNSRFLVQPIPVKNES